MEFVAACGATHVFTIFGSAPELAREIARRFRIRAEPLRGR